MEISMNAKKYLDKAKEARRKDDPVEYAHYMAKYDAQMKKQRRGV
jgi:hypothetical protein